MNLLLMRARCFPVHGRPMQRNAMIPVSREETLGERVEASGPTERDDEPKHKVRRQLGFSRLKTWAFSS